MPKMTIRDIGPSDYFTFRFPQEGWMDTFTIWRILPDTITECTVQIRAFESPGHTVEVSRDLHIEVCPDTQAITLRFAPDRGYEMERPQWSILSGLTLAQSIVVSNIASGKSEFVPVRDNANDKLAFVLFPPEYRDTVLADMNERTTIVPGYLLEEPSTYKQPRFS